MRILLLVVCFLIGVLIATNPFAKKDDPRRFLPPTYEGIEAIGCKIEQVSTGKDSFWHTHIWIAYKDSLFMKLFSIRPADERKKALEDCNWWMDYVRKNAPKPPKQRLPLVRS